MSRKHPNMPGFAKSAWLEPLLSIQSSKPVRREISRIDCCSRKKRKRLAHGVSGSKFHGMS